MREIRERLGTAIVLITHDLGVVADLADRVLVIYAGRKAEEAPAADLFAAPAASVHDRRCSARSRGRRRRPRRLREIPGRVPAAARAARRLRVRRPLPARRRRLRGSVPELASVRAGHLVACFHPGPE